MPAASYVATPIERSLAFAKSSPSSNSLGGYRNKFQMGDPTSNTILTTKLDFIKYEKPSVKADIKSKYHTLSVNNINDNISSICSTYSKSKLSLNNVSSCPTLNDLRKSLTSSKDNSSNGKCLLPKPKEVLYSPSKITLGWQGRVPPGAGLVNAINTCYLNSCLQALFHIPSFHNWLLNDTEHQSLCEKQSGFQFECLVCAMRKTLTHCQAKSGGAIRPELIIKKLKLIARHLEHHRQEDSHEFLTYLIEGMQKSYLKAIPGANKLDSYSKETTPIYQLFGCYLRTEVACSACSHVSTSYTHSTELSLDIRQSSSLDEALGHFFAKEMLGGDNLYRCEKCGRKVEATKRFSVDKPPNVLRLQLKRFNFHGFKNSRSVLVPHHLEFGKYLYGNGPPYSLSSTQPRTSLKYKLVSAVIHHGSSPDSGHYTCIGSTSSGMYHYFDDEMVRASNLNQLTNAYVVFYELLPSSAPHAHSLHSSSPGLASSSSSTSLSEPRKLIGPQLPPNHNASSPSKSSPNQSAHILSAAVTSNIDVDKMAASSGSSSNGAKFNNNTTPQTAKSGLSGSTVARPTVPPPPPPVNGARPCLNGSKPMPNGGLMGSKLVQNGGLHGPLCGPTKLPSPSFLHEKAVPGGAASVAPLSGGKTGGGDKLMTNGFASPSKAGAGVKPLSSGVNGSEEGGLKKFPSVNGIVSGAAVRSSPAKTSGRDSPSSARAGLKRTSSASSSSTPAKLVDYESDDESLPEDHTGGQDRKTSRKHKTNGWIVEEATGGEGSGSGRVARGGGGCGSESVNKVTAGHMEWSVVPVTPPSIKVKVSPPTPDQPPSTPTTPTPHGSDPPTPSSSPSPSPSLASSPRSTQSSASAASGSGGGSRNYFASALSTEGTGARVTDYLQRRTLTGDSSYGSNNVTSWSNEPSSLVQESGAAAVTAQSKFPRYRGGGEREEDDEEMDRGRVKKSKYGKASNDYYGKHNPFSHYHNNRKSSNYNGHHHNGSGGDKYHFHQHHHGKHHGGGNYHRHHPYRHQPYARRY